MGVQFGAVSESSLTQMRGVCSFSFFCPSPMCLSVQGLRVFKGWWWRRVFLAMSGVTPTNDVIAKRLCHTVILREKLRRASPGSRRLPRPG